MCVTSDLVIIAENVYMYVIMVFWNVPSPSSVSPLMPLVYSTCSITVFDD